MLRTFNYTKRKRIPKELINISLLTIGEETHFNAQIKCENIELPPYAKVYIEAYYGPNSYRFDFGILANIQQPVDTNITELTKVTDQIYFRVKVVDEEKGLILGYADKIQLVGEDSKSRTSILYVNPVILDTTEIWRMNFSADGDGTPILEVNRAIDDIRDIVKRDAKFLALVFPAAIRLVLAKIAEDNNFDKDGSSWSSKWIAFTQDILGVQNTPDDNEDKDKLNEWYDDVVRSFCIKNKLFDQFIKILL